MPKEFPQIRLNGDKTQAVGHVKRGMLELFKTQSVQELAGVPIMKRTVEVDSSTTITVQIAKEQTFIDITSTGEVVEFDEEEEVSEQDIYKCPAGFIIRKFDPASKGIGGFAESDREQGYIIAYNHSKGEWVVAQYQDVTGSGNTFAHASNIGWWHVPNKKAYSSCDVITWYGQSHFDFSSTINPDNDTEGWGKKNMLTGYFFFKGRKFLVGNKVLGACIIDVAGVDYIYVMTMFPLTEETTSKFSGITSRRMTVGALLSGSEDWEVAGSLDYGDFGYVGDTTDDFWDWPTSTAYIDPDGYAYLVMKHSDQLPHQLSLTNNPGLTTLHRGVTEFMKFNLRDLSYEVLNSSRDCIPVLTVTGFTFDLEVTVGGAYVWPNDTGATLDVAWSYSNVGRPWTFYALGGTKDLWTFALEWDANASEANSNTGNFFGSGVDYTITGSAYLNCTMIVSKNLKEFKRIPILTRSGGTECLYHRQDPYPKHAEFPLAEAVAMARNIIEYHPEIEGSLRYTELNLAANGATSWELKEDGRTVDQIIDTVPANYSYDDDFEGDVIGEYWTPNLQTHANARRMARTLGENGGRDGVVSGDFPIATLVVGEKYQQRFEFAELINLGSHNTGILTGNMGLIGTNGPVGGNSWLRGSVGTRKNNAWKYQAGYGSADGWWYSLEEDSGRYIPVEGFAVHRPTNTGRGTKPPYIYLKRKIRLCKDQDADQNSWYNADIDKSSIRLADTDPRTHDPLQPADFNQETDSIGQTFYSRKHWWMWSEPLGYYQQVDYDKDDPDQTRAPQWKDDGWTLESNVLTAKQLNQMTKDSDKAFFEIGVL